MIVQKEMSSRAWTELFILGCIWGGVFVAVAEILEDIPPVTLVAIRVAGATFILWLYVLMRGHALPKDIRIWGALLVMGLLNTALPFSLLTFGQTEIESGLTSIFNSFTAVMGTLVAAIFLPDEKMTPRKLIGVICGFVGVATIVGLNAFQTFDLRSIAQLACIGATVSYAFAGVWARKKLQNIHAEVATAGMLLGATAFLIPAAFLFEGIPTMNWSYNTWWSLAYLIPIATVLAYIMYFRIVEMAGSSNTLLVTLIVSIVAVILGAVIRSETLSIRDFIGFGLIALGLLIIDGRLWALKKRVFSS